tara:strand:+ start:429 stop:572 length:144 start_codon:yes stop_codon:yes gene_type:complete
MMDVVVDGYMTTVLYSARAATGGGAKTISRKGEKSKGLVIALIVTKE